MQIKKGKDRIVFIFPTIWVVIKFPYRFAWGIRSFLYALRKKRLKKEWQLSLHLPYGSKRFLLKGIMDNWREFRFYRKTRHPFLQPTYLSVFGLLNIQRLGQPCGVEPTDLWCQLDELTQGAVFKDSHHFDNPDNFCFQDGSLRIIDYGGPHVQEVISEFGMKIMEDFDPEYSWEERKKEIKEEREKLSAV